MESSGTTTERTSWRRPSPAKIKQLKVTYSKNNDPTTADATAESLAARDPPAMLPRRSDQILARLGRAERRMGRQRDVRQFGQRMIRRQRLDVEDIEAGMADMAGLQGVDHRGFVDHGAARGVDEDDARLHRGDAFCGKKAAGFVVEQKMQRDHLALRQ